MTNIEFKKLLYHKIYTHCKSIKRMTSLTTSINGESKEEATNESPPVFDDEEQEAIVELRQLLLPKYKDDEWFSTYLDDSTLWRYLVSR